MKCTEDGRPFLDKECSLPGDPRIARLHHYFFRDKAFLSTKRMCPGHNEKKDAWWDQEDQRCSVLTDTTIHRFVPKLRRRMGLDKPTTSSRASQSATLRAKAPAA
jgi:hypothetical protein